MSYCPNCGAEIKDDAKKRKYIKNKRLIICIITSVILILVASIIIYNIKANGNLANDDKSGPWIYFSTAHEVYDYPGGRPKLHRYDSIYKMKTDGKGKTKLCDDKASNINIEGEWIYYTNESNNGKLYKIMTDGTEGTKLCDDRANNIKVEGEWIYYTNESKDDKLYKIKIDGSGRTKLCDDKTDYIEVAGGWIYYKNEIGNYGEDVFGDNKVYKLYRIKTDGTERTELVNSCGGGPITVAGDWIYYSSASVQHGVPYGIFKMRTDGSEKTKLCESEYSDATAIYIVDDWIYYFEGGLCGQLFKIKNDGTGRIQLKDINADDKISIEGDWIYYNSNVWQYHNLYKIKIDGTEKTKLDGGQCVDFAGG